MTTASEASEAKAEVSVWRQIAAAIGKTGGGALSSGLLSALSIKIVASLLGPGSLALLQTLQQLRDGALTAATANGRTALVQGASAHAGIERREYLRTAAVLFAGGTVLVALAMIAAPAGFLAWSRLPASSGPLLPWLAATVALLSVFVFLGAILNALRELGKLALLQLVAPAAAAVVAWPVAAKVRAGHPLAIVFFLAIPAAASVLLAAASLAGHRDELRDWFQGPGRWWTGRAARHFLSISGAMLASGLAAMTVLLAVRGAITRQEGLAMTGQFDAAWSISMNHVTLILGSVQAYYLPSLAAAPSPEARASQIRSMLMVATMVTVPVIVTIAALKPLAVSLLYSPAFAASPQFLRWTLIGDYLKVSSWVLATPLLATRDLGPFLALDLLTHATFFALALLLARIVRPSESAAIGFLISYALYFVSCLLYARMRYGFQFGRAGFAAWLGGLALVLGTSADAWQDSAAHYPRAAVWIILSVIFSGGFALYMRRREA